MSISKDPPLPHLLHLTISHHGLEWEVECPYLGKDAGERPCAWWLEEWAKGTGDLPAIVEGLRNDSDTPVRASLPWAVALDWEEGFGSWEDSSPVLRLWEQGR